MISFVIESTEQVSFDAKISVGFYKSSVLRSQYATNDVFQRNKKCGGKSTVHSSKNDSQASLRPSASPSLLTILFLLGSACFNFAVMDYLKLNKAAEFAWMKNEWFKDICSKIHTDFIQQTIEEAKPILKKELCHVKKPLEKELL